MRVTHLCPPADPVIEVVGYGLHLLVLGQEDHGGQIEMDNACAAPQEVTTRSRVPMCHPHPTDSAHLAEGREIDAGEP